MINVLRCATFFDFHFLLSLCLFFLMHCIFFTNFETYAHVQRNSTYCFQYLRHFILHSKMKVGCEALSPRLYYIAFFVLTSKHIFILSLATTNIYISLWHRGYHQNTHSNLATIIYIENFKFIFSCDFRSNIFNMFSYGPILSELALWKI